MNKNIVIIIGVVALGAIMYLLFADADTTASRQGGDTLAISTSFYPLAFALEEITGDLATVTNIGEGRDPHDFRPSVQNILTLQRSDLVVLQGADFETWGDDIIEQLEREDVPLAIATDGLSLREGGHDHDHGDDNHEEDEHGHDDEEYDSEHSHDDDHDHDEEHADEDHDDEHDHGAYDPHTWLDPILFGETVENLIAKVSEIDPTNAATYEMNGRALLERLAALHTAYEERLSRCSLDEVITSHEAIGYVAARYDFAVHSIGGLSTQDTPSSVTLAELREEAEEGIGAILLEENSITAYGETLARETGLQTLPFNPVAYRIEDGENYFSLMEQNLATLETALRCND